MRDLLGPLAEAGAWALGAVWLPVLAWTGAALAAEAALRLRHHALVGLGVRRALLFALPAGVLAASVLPALLPTGAVETVLAARPAALTLPTITVGAAPAPEASGGAAAVPLAALVSGLALVAAALVGLWRGVGVALALVRLRSVGSDEAPEAVQSAVDAAAREAGVRRPVRAAVAPRPVVPFTFGWRRPVVVVPAPLVEDPAALRLAVAHEVAHVARGDFAWGVAERAAASLFAWHPLVGVLARGLALDRERATDAAVLAHRPDERRAYADLLLSFSRLPSPALALGAARGCSALETRLLTMQTLPLPPARLRAVRRLARGLGALLFALAVGAAALLAVGPEPVRAASGGAIAPETPAVAATPLAEAAPEPEATPTPEDSAAPEASGEAAARPITGRVFDTLGGQPLPGASVAVVGTRIGAATDAEGRFTLNGVDPGDVQIRVTRAGYRPLVVTPEPDVPLRIGLVPERLEELQQQAEEMRRLLRERNARVQDVDPDSPEAPEIFEVVEQQPRLVGGLEALQRSVVYPPEAREAGVQGKVFVQFVVDEEGAVQDARAVRCPDELLCEAALEAVRSAEFQPGLQRGRPVKVRFTLPVDFRLPETDE